MFDRTILRRYAQTANPTKLSPSTFFTHTDRTITIFDGYPKAIFHFLVLPRITGAEPKTASRLASLNALVRMKKGATNEEMRETMKEAKGVLEGVREDARDVKRMVEDEMAKRYGFKWGVWMGFHAIPSMEHIHLHVISDDLCSPTLKRKKHYNSFHPKLGFFMHLDDVVEWFDAEPEVFKTLSTINISEYEAKLKEPLVCFRCNRSPKNIPALKEHLQAEFDTLAETERRKVERKRKHESSDGDLSHRDTKTKTKDGKLEEGSNDLGEGVKRPHVNEDT